MDKNNGNNNGIMEIYLKCYTLDPQNMGIPLFCGTHSQIGLTSEQRALLKGYLYQRKSF
jgi:hypothetical protein